MLLFFNISKCDEITTKLYISKLSNLLYGYLFLTKTLISVEEFAKFFFEVSYMYIVHGHKCLSCRVWVHN